MSLCGARSRLGILSSSKLACKSPHSRSDFRALQGFSAAIIQNVLGVSVDHHVLCLSVSPIPQHVPGTEDFSIICQIHERKQAEKKIKI